MIENTDMELPNALLTDIHSIIKKYRAQAYVSVNVAMIESYWQIGKRIVEEEQKGSKKAAYGTYLIHELSKQLTAEFGQGFSEANIKNFRQFYLTFNSEQIRYALSSELSWTHYRMLMRVENTNAREYYIKESAEQRWSTRQLERNINTLYYERILSTKEKRKALEQQQKMEKIQVEDFIKDPYVLEFLGLDPPAGFSEKDMEKAIISNIQQFLLEMGKGFSFVGRQYRIATEPKNFYIDLVFYNYLLKCFVLIDIKVNELTHQDIGQMDMYVRLFEDRIKTEGDNPTIGIILCTEKDHLMVKYSVLEESEQLFASKYRLILPSEKELELELKREKQLINDLKAELAQKSETNKQKLIHELQNTLRTKSERERQQFINELREKLEQRKE